MKLKNKITLSVVIATFNSEKKLKFVFSGINLQSFTDYEVLVIDGGSSDNTIEMAKKFGAKIIHNKKNDPVNAKLIGIKNAKGKYLVFLDHDEELTNKNSFREKINIFKNHTDVKFIICSGYESDESTSFINRFINEFGDPFSFYMYRLSKDKDFFYSSLRKKYNKIFDSSGYSIFKISKQSNLIIELCAAGSFLDLDFIKKSFPKIILNPNNIPLLFYYIVNKFPYLTITKNDSIVHHSSENWNVYKNKIKWRIKNNIFGIQDIKYSGFLGRQRFESKSFKIKKYLFPIYNLIVAFPIIDGVYLAITRKKISYLLYPLISLYTVFQIMYLYFLKIVDIPLKNVSYEGDKLG